MGESYPGLKDVLVAAQVSRTLLVSGRDACTQFHLTYIPHSEAMTWCPEFRGHKSMGSTLDQPQGWGLDQGLKVLATIPGFTSMTSFPQWPSEEGLNCLHVIVEDRGFLSILPSLPISKARARDGVT